MNRNNLQEQNLYGNCEMYSPSDILMFRCRLKKINWYVSRGLAEIIQDNEDRVKAKLLFEPKGNGNHGDAFSLEEQENRCSSCGDTDELTRHHIVPTCYRKHFPLENKSHYHHDIVVICRDCHDSYEEEAFKIKQDLAEQHSAPLSVSSDVGWYTKADWKISSIANAYMSKPNVREDIKQKWSDEITNYLGRDFNDEDLIKMINLKEEINELIRDHGKIVVNSQDSLQNFVEIWRQHFIDVSQPKYMSKHWSITRPI